MLGKPATARNAFHHSPEREQRELLFAADRKQPPPQGGALSPKPVPEPEEQGGSDALTRWEFLEHTGKGVLAAGLIEGMAGKFGSSAVDVTGLEEAAEKISAEGEFFHLLFREWSDIFLGNAPGDRKMLEGTLREVARKRGITISENTDRVSAAEQIAAACGGNPPLCQEMVKAALKEAPIALRFARRLERRAAERSLAMESFERLREWDAPLLALIERKESAEQEALASGQIDDEARELASRIRQHVEKRIASENYPSAFRTLVEKHYFTGMEITDLQIRKQELARLYHTLVWEMESKVHRLRSSRASTLQGKTEKEIQAAEEREHRQSRERDLAHSRRLREAVDEHLRREAMELEAALIRPLAELTGVSEKEFRVFITQKPRGEADRKKWQDMFQKLDAAARRSPFGVSLAAILPEWSQSISHLRRTQRLDPRASPYSFDLHFTLPPSADPEAEEREVREGKREESFFEHAEKRLQEHEILKCRLEKGAAAYLAEWQEREMNKELWIRLTRKRIQILEGRQWLEEIEKMLQPREALAALKEQLSDISEGGWTDAGINTDFRNNVDRFLATLENEPLCEEAAAAERSLHVRAQQRSREDPAGKKIAEICQQTRDRLDTVMGNLLPVDAKTGKRGLAQHLRSTVSEVLDVQQAFTALEKRMLEKIERAGRATSEEWPIEKKRRALSEVEEEIERLKSCDSILRSITVIRKPFSPEETKARVKGEFDPSEKIVSINTAFDEKTQESAKDHEMGHAVLYALTTGSGLFTDFLLTGYEELKQTMDPDDLGTKRTLGDNLETLANRENSPYQFIRLQYEKKRRETEKNRGDLGTRAKLERDYHRDLMDELYNQYASWVRSGSHAGTHTPEEQALFSHIAERTLPAGDLTRPPDMEDLPPEKSPAEQRNVLEDARRRRGTNPQSKLRFADTPDATDEEHAAPEEAWAHMSGFNMKQELLEIERGLYNIVSLIDAYEDVAAGLRPWVREAQENYRNLEEIFKHPEKRFHYPPTADENEQVRDYTIELKKWTEETLELLHNHERDALDTSTAQKRPLTGLRGLFSGIRLLSILDIVKLYKDTQEDILAIYKRRQDRLLWDVGGALFKPISDTFRNTPYVNGLWMYHQRRYAGGELEAAEKWKKALENEDSHTVLDMIAKSTNKDMVRGSIDLLTDRGEMDWNHEGVWHTLMHLSRYSMPVEACRRNDILRDTWLRKMITVIWNDKELYFHWRTANDSKTASGKQSFTNTVDQISNIQGGMRAELRKQLLLKHRFGDHPPEDVKPHLYEETLEYAMRNGKMTMEDKMYYLVQGVAHDILSIDRLRVLAGEKVGLINRFPWIEYFYGKNNTLPEIRTLADRLTEYDGHGKRTFEPGAKTTFWLHYVVSREQTVQHRMSKGISRGAESIDHEDIPFIVPQVDYNDINGLADVISGARQKVTTEGWKNAYVGYNSKFKIFSNLVRMDELGLDRFTRNDASQLAHNIAAFIHMDNILTQNGTDKPGRPALSEFQYESRPVSGAKNHTVSEYRQKMVRFIQELVGPGGIFADKITWNAGELAGVTREQYLPELEAKTRNSREVSAKVWAGTKAFVRQLESAIAERKEDFMAKLVEFENRATFLDEGGSSEKITESNARQFYGAEARAEARHPPIPAGY